MKLFTIMDAIQNKEGFYLLGIESFPSTELKVPSTHYFLINL